MFKENEMTLGLFFPIESYEGSIPEMDMTTQMLLAKKAEDMQFASLFVRDIPLYDPHFGDVGQIYDPWVFLGFLSAHTKRISLTTGSILTTLRHPLHVAKAAASVDRMSGNRLILGAATGDRPIEFGAFNVDQEKKVQLFQESLHVMREVWKEESPKIQATNVDLQLGDVLPKPELKDIPILVTGHSGQTRDWIAKHGDGWLFYPRNLDLQTLLINEWGRLCGEFEVFGGCLFIVLWEVVNEGL